MIFEKIRVSNHDPHRALFPLWSRVPARETVSSFTETFKENFPSCKLVAYIDNQLPVMLFGRTNSDQRDIDSSYVHLFPKLGFDDVVFTSDILPEFVLSDFFSVISKFTVNELNFVVPSHKKTHDGDYSAKEVFEFAWQVMTCDFGLKHLQCDAILAGMATRHFYYTARKVLPQADIYFARGKTPQKN